MQTAAVMTVTVGGVDEPFLPVYIYARFTPCVSLCNHFNLVYIHSHEGLLV